MKLLNCKVSLFIIIIFLLSGCNTAESSNTDSSPTQTPAEISKADNLPTPTPVLQKKPLTEIDLTMIKHIDNKGRAQDGSLEDKDFEELPIAKDLLAHGKDSIPFLIGKLEDETEMKRGTIDFWYQVYVGDIALVILNDFFTKDDELTWTIPGFGWDEFLERGNDKASMGEAILRKYIKKHGRKNIKDRWQKVWDENKDNIFWDETERCFKLGK